MREIILSDRQAMLVEAILRLHITHLREEAIKHEMLSDDWNAAVSEAMEVQGIISELESING